MLSFFVKFEVAKEIQTINFETNIKKQRNKMEKNNIQNPFLAPYGTLFNAIPYDRITLEHYIPAVKEAIRMEKATIDAICGNDEPATFENTIVALDRAGLHTLGR